MNKKKEIKAQNNEKKGLNYEITLKYLLFLNNIILNLIKILKL